MNTTERVSTYDSQSPAYHAFEVFLAPYGSKDEGPRLAKGLGAWTARSADVC